MCAGTSKDRERNKRMLTACCHIYHRIPRCCQEMKPAEAQGSRAERRGRRKRDGREVRNKDGFAIVVTLSGFICQSDPTWPCSHPTATASYMNSDHS